MSSYTQMYMGSFLTRKMDVDQISIQEFCDRVNKAIAEIKMHESQETVNRNFDSTSNHFMKDLQYDVCSYLGRRSNWDEDHIRVDGGVSFGTDSFSFESTPPEEIIPMEIYVNADVWLEEDHDVKIIKNFSLFQINREVQKVPMSIPGKRAMQYMKRVVVVGIEPSKEVKENYSVNDSFLKIFNQMVESNLEPAANAAETKKGD